MTAPTGTSRIDGQVAEGQDPQRQPARLTQSAWRVLLRWSRLRPARTSTEVASRTTDTAAALPTSSFSTSENTCTEATSVR